MRRRRRFIRSLIFYFPRNNHLYNYHQCKRQVFWICLQAGKAKIRSLFLIILKTCSVSDRGSAHIEIPVVGNEGKTPARDFLLLMALSNDFTVNYVHSWISLMSLCIYIRQQRLLICSKFHGISYQMKSLDYKRCCVYEMYRFVYIDKSVELAQSFVTIIISNFCKFMLLNCCIIHIVVCTFSFTSSQS